MVQLQEDAATLDSLGYQIIAIGTDLPEKIAETEKKWGIGFPMLSDPDLRAAHAYGVAYRQEGKRGLPVPAVFIVDTDRRVQFEYVNPRYQVRLGRDILLVAARGLAH